MNEVKNPVPTEIILHRGSRILEVVFGEERFRLPFEFLRVYSPSAEVQGHGPGQEVLQTGKRHVDILDLEPVGLYGVKPLFSDGHESGIFSWVYLRELGRKQEDLWHEYEARLVEAGMDRDTPMPASPGSSCGH